MTLNISKRTLRVLTIMMVFGGISVSGTEGVPTGAGAAAEPAAGPVGVGQSAEQQDQERKGFWESFNQFTKQFKDLNEKWNAFKFDETEDLGVVDEKIKDLEGILGEYETLNKQVTSLQENVNRYSTRNKAEKIERIKTLKESVAKMRTKIQGLLDEIYATIKNYATPDEIIIAER